MEKQIRKKQKVVTLWLEEGISQKEAYLHVFPQAKDETISLFFSSPNILKYIKKYFGNPYDSGDENVLDFLWQEIWDDAQKIKNETIKEKNWSGANAAMKTLVSLFFRRQISLQKKSDQIDENVEEWEVLLKEFENIFNK